MRLERVQDALGGQYVVERELGRGTMAAVFLGREEASGRTVALKILRPEFARTVGPERFQREIRILGRLDHPNILPLLASGEEQGLIYYVMPFATGDSLRARLDREAQLAVDDALTIARGVAAALDHAHRHHVLHRDIKPGNVVFEEGRAMVCDFGVARAISTAGGERISSSGLVVGTPSYMSPEQAGGATELDARSDLYSLACVLYEMLAGEPPFTGRTAQAIMMRHARERPPSVHVLRPDVPETVDAALRAALAKNPEDRPADADSFSRRLEQTQ